MNAKQIAKTLAVALVSLAASAPLVVASPAHAAPTYSTTTDVGRRTAPTASPDGGYGIAARTAFSPICQTEGEAHGRFGNRLYFLIKAPRENRNIYVPDAFTNSPHLAHQGPIAGIPMCGQTQPRTPSGAGDFSNAAVADFLLGRLGQNWGYTNGQCRQTVNIAVSNVSGGRTTVGGYRDDYNEGFRRAGAYRVPSWQGAIKGDIVQVGTNESSRRLHTYVIVANYGNGTFRVVDSNARYDTTIRTYDRSFDHNGGAVESTIWRVGRA